MDKIKSSHSFGDYLIQLSKTNDRLSIEIEVPASGRTYFVELDDDAISQVSQEIFPNVDAMFQGLEQAIAKTFKEVALTFNGSGKLTYKIGFSVGPIQKDHQFTIDLQEKNNDALTIFEKKIEDRFDRLVQRVSNIEGNIPLQNGNGHSNLHNNNGDMGKRFDLLEKRVDLLEKKITEIEQTKVSRVELQNVIDAFNKLEERVLQGQSSNKILAPVAGDPDASNQLKMAKSFHNQDVDKDHAFAPYLKKDFEFFNNHKAVQYIGAHLGEVPLSKPLPKSGVFELKLKLETVPMHFWFGIVDEEVMEANLNERWFERNYFYSTKHGSICYNTKHFSVMKNPSENKGKVGDVLTFIIDVDREIFSVQVNGKEINSAKISLQNHTNYYPYCGLLSKYCRISIV